MSRRIFYSFYLIFATAVAFFSFSSAQTKLEPAQVLDNVRETYETLEDITATFTEEVTFKYTNVHQSLTGEFQMKRGNLNGIPNKYRIHTEQQTIVTDGITVWSYSPINKQVLIDDYNDDSKTFSPDKFLFSIPNDFQAVFLNERPSSPEIQSDYALKLIPRAGTASAAAVKSFKIWVSRKDWSIRKIEFIDMNETQRTYTIHSRLLNLGLSDKHFSFTVPNGVQVVDLRILKAKARRH
ncbi:MAG: outer membrane lipoprotein carrier protein LolA [Bacteroidota bacterium]|nr:outer membrane lipoprotein carrier protein LolA [Bacteroidota bacterium]